MPGCFNYFHLPPSKKAFKKAKTKKLQPKVESPVPWPESLGRQPSGQFRPAIPVSYAANRPLSSGWAGDFPQETPPLIVKKPVLLSLSARPCGHSAHGPFLQAITSPIHECAGHIVPFATVRLEEPKAHKPAHSKLQQEVIGVMAKDHALLDRIQEMRKEELERVEKRSAGRGFPW